MVVEASMRPKITLNPSQLHSYYMHDVYSMSCYRRRHLAGICQAGQYNYCQLSGVQLARSSEGGRRVCVENVRNLDEIK